MILMAVVLVGLSAGACSSSTYRFDDGAVVPLGSYCVQAKSSVADLVGGIQIEKAGAFLGQLTSDGQLQSSIKVLVEANGEPAVLKEQNARDAANDLRQWLNLACPPLGSAPLAPPPSS